MANYQLEQTGAEVQALLNAVESPDTTPAAGSSNLITSGAVQAAVAGVSAEVTALGRKVGDLSGLATTQNSDLVSAVNELNRIAETQIYRIPSLVFNQAYLLASNGSYATTTDTKYFATQEYYAIPDGVRKLVAALPGLAGVYGMICFYDSSKNFISNISSADSQTTKVHIEDIPDGAALVRFAYMTASATEAAKVYAGFTYDEEEAVSNAKNLTQKVGNLEPQINALVENEEIILFQPSQDFTGAIRGSEYQGQAVFIENVKGFEFDKVLIPLLADSASQDFTLVIGQTNGTNSQTGIRDALSSDNILATKTIKLGTALGYTNIVLDSRVKITKENCAIGVYTASGSHAYNAYYSDNTDKVRTTYLMISDVWYSYGGGAAIQGYGPLPYLEISNKTKEAIDELQSQLGNNSLDVVLPNKLTAVVGDTLQVFYRSIVRAFNPYEKNILLSCVKGAQYPRYFQYTPVSGDVGTTTFEAKIRSNDFSEIVANSCSLKTVSVVGSPASNKNIVCLGDSLTAGGVWVAEASRRLVGSGGTPAGNGLTNITFCGAMGSDNAKYFGVGGWTWAAYTTAGVTAYRFQVSGVTSIELNTSYTNNGSTFRVIEVNTTAGSGNILCQRISGTNAPTASGTLTKAGSGAGDATISFSSSALAPGNPFWDEDNNKISFAHYANTYCGGQIDAVYVLLGANELSPNKTDFSSTIAHIKDFADELHLEFPSAKLKIMGCAGVSHNGGMGAEYGATGSGYADEYGIFLAMFNLDKAYQEFANQDAYSSFVEYVDVMSQLDSENNFPRSQSPVNTRNAATEYRGTNGVHPAESGQYQIADVAYRSIVAEFCQ